MEGIIVNHQRNRFKGIKDIKKIKNELWEKYLEKDKISIHTLQLDHIIPFSISLDNSSQNLQLLKPKEHLKKSIIDKKIIKKFREKGWIEKVTNYSHELKKSIEFLVKEFKKELKKLVGLVGLDGLPTLNSPIRNLG